MAENQLSRWHMIPSTELWHFYKGAPFGADHLPYGNTPSAETHSG
ncbi:cupin domain-containing protein [Acidithiobacillus sp.]|nr:hypothetical protein [Acidithiobacillus sp. HP-11]MBU2740236.1 cupin domain-containing protein [Acidithiobacillus albertensis]